MKCGAKRKDLFRPTLYCTELFYGFQEILLKINREHIVGLICIGIASTVLLITPSFPKGQENVNLTGPAFFPDILAIIYLVLGAIQIILGFKRKKNQNEKPAVPSAAKPSMRLLLEFMGLLIGFLLLFQPLGFILCTILFLFLLMLLLGVTVPKSILFSFVYTGAIYLLFGKLFTIGLPVGILSIFGM